MTSNHIWMISSREKRILEKKWKWAVDSYQRFECTWPGDFPFLAGSAGSKWPTQSDKPKHFVPQKENITILARYIKLGPRLQVFEIKIQLLVGFLKIQLLEISGVGKWSRSLDEKIIGFFYFWSDCFSSIRISIFLSIFFASDHIITSGDPFFLDWIISY